jgi:hypothetical protein
MRAMMGSVSAAMISITVIFGEMFAKFGTVLQLLASRATARAFVKNRFPLKFNRLRELAHEGFSVGTALAFLLRNARSQSNRRSRGKTQSPGGSP